MAGVHRGLARRRERRRRSRLRVVRSSLPAIAAASAAIAGVLVFSAFIYTMTGRPLAWLEAHAAWGAHLRHVGVSGPVPGTRAGGLYGYARSQPIDARESGRGARRPGGDLAGDAAFRPAMRRVHRHQPDSAAHQWRPALDRPRDGRRCSRCSSGSPPSCSARHRAAWLTAFALLQGWGAALFFTWREFI
ncbi:MAG: hypothetical protein MZV64_42400 [Ignavibacteriales bacterium]|nr:hypothetical protein [Ignavibacteriales bacterium]